MSNDSSFPRIGARRVARSRWLIMERTYHLTPGEGWMQREVIRHPGAVAVVPIDGDVIHMIRQHRTAAGTDLLEIPAGKLGHPDEPPAAAAARECREEIGCDPRRLTRLHDFYTTPGFTDERMWLFLAEDLVPVPASPQGPEERAAATVKVPIADLPALLPDLADAKTIIGVLALLRTL